VTYFQVIYERANAQGSTEQTAGAKMANTHNAVGTCWA
jgi:hypothetical protein